MRFLRFLRPVVLVGFMVPVVWVGQWKETKEERYLREAVQNGNIDDARRLLAAGAHTTNPRLKYENDGGKYFLGSLLLDASNKGRLPLAQLLVNHGAGVSSLHWPLIAALLNDHLDIARLLIEKGADVNIGTRHYTPLVAACERGHFEIVKLLVSKGANVNGGKRGFDRNTPLLVAERNGFKDIAGYLRKAGAKP